MAMKSPHLKYFVTALFEWVKQDAGEQIFHFEVCDLNELSRDIMLIVCRRWKTTILAEMRYPKQNT